MPTPIAECVDVTMALQLFADAAGVSADDARKMLRALAELPREVGDTLLAEARRQAIRDLSTQLRRRKR